MSIAPELKDARRNLPRALVAAPIIILVLYLGYFVGISCFLGPQTVIEAGDASLSLMFVKLFGEQAGALPNVIAFIAVLGGANGMVLATLRMPQSLALHHMMPLEHIVSRMNPTLRFPVVSAMIALVTTLFWVGAHTVVSTLGLLPNGDISEVMVAMTMLILPLYYIEALRGALREDAPALTRARRATAPAIALASSLAIGLSSISDPTRWPFVVAFTALLLVITFALTPKRDA